MSHVARNVVVSSTSKLPDLLESFDDDVFRKVVEDMDRPNITETELADLVFAHQRSIYDTAPKSRYIDLRKVVKQFACFEDETTCFFIVPPGVWTLERTHTDFTDTELKSIAFVHTLQTRKRAEATDRVDALELLEDRFGFIVYKPPFMKRAHRLHQETLLSEREAEVQALAEAGHTSKEIAKVLGISPGTVDSIRYNRIAKKVSEARATVELLDTE